MPRIAKTEMQKRGDELFAAVNYYREKNRIGKMEFHDKVGMAHSTFNLKERAPETLLLGDLFRMANILNVAVHIQIGEFTI